MRVEIIYDPSCPWCYIGKRQLEKAMEQRADVQIERVWTPFLLNPDMPAEGVDRTPFFIRKFGSEARMARMFRAITHMGQSVEINFAFDQIRRAPNTVNAHRLVRYAGSFGRADAAVEALFHNHFVKGLDIGDLAVLIEIGRRLDLNERALQRYLASDADLAAIYAENARAHRLGINGVPAFVFAGVFVICGAQDPKVLTRMLDVARESASRPLAWVDSEARSRIL